MARYAADATALAHRAAVAAIDESGRSGVSASDITHIVTVSCTGFTAPGIDHALIDRLGLGRTVRRLHIGYMGCHGAINALAAARAIVLSEPHAHVLVVCVELCSLHFQPTGRPDQVVANALFADGAAAMVITADAARTPLARIASTGGCVFKDSADAMAWRIGDHGFEMTLGESVPRLIADYLRPWLAAWLDGQNQSLDELVDCGNWAIHPGGPRILDAVAASLGLCQESTRSSRHVLASYGNMSSPTVLFILDRFVRKGIGSSRPTVLVAFGPGLSVEAALLTP
jgi:predicted naringenin-chalcone synthase